MVKFSPIAQSCRVYVTTRSGKTRYQTYEIMHVTIHWGRTGLEDTPQRRRLSMALYIDTGGHLDQLAQLSRAKIEVAIAPTWSSNQIPLFQGYIDEVKAHLKSDGYITVHTRAVEGAPHEPALSATVSGLPPSGTVEAALTHASKHMSRNNGGAISAQMTAPAKARLYPASHKQKSLTAKQWFEAVTAAAPGSHPLWSPDFRQCRASTHRPAVSATTYSPTLEAKNIVSSDDISIPLHSDPRSITIIRTGSAIGPAAEEYLPITTKANKGPAFTITSDYGIFDGGTETFAELWKLQKTTPRIFTISDHHYPDTWPIWRTMEEPSRVLTIANDPIAAAFTAPPHFTPIGGSLKITPTKTTHTLHCIWRSAT